MADRTVSVALRGNVTQFMASMRAASKSTEDFARRNRAEMETVGAGLLGIGTAAVGGLGLATKAAIDWESAWAGVTKTVEGSEAQMSALQQDLRDMAKELPASHEEIAAVAEAAGQLGVETDSVAEFSRVMIDLGETTNLSADQAATSLARFSNIMGTSQDDVSRLGSTLVDLGNNSETTEAEILELATRMAAAGEIAGLSESDVLGFAAAVTSVGVPAEAAGTALSKTFQTMRDAVLDGGDALDTFAEVSGTTADEFARHFEEDPADAIATFIAGLGRMNEQGQSTTGVFEDLSLNNERLKRALLSTAEAEDLLVNSLDRGETAWQENTALTEEAQRRYETASAQISMAWNSIRDAAIEVGSVVAPVVAGLAGHVGTLADAFGDLPEGVDIAVASILGIGGAASVAGGALLLLLPRIAETRAAMQTLGLTTGRTGTALRGLGRAAGAGMGLLAVVGVLEALHQASVEAGTGIGEMTESLLRLRQGEVTDAIDSLIEKRDKLADRNMWLDIASGLSGVFARRHDADEFSNEIDSVDQALAGLVQGGNIEDARDSVEALGERLGLSGDELDRWVERNLPEYQDALARTRAEQMTTGDSTDDLAGDFEEQKTAAEEAQDALQNYRDELRAMTDPVFGLLDALDQVETAQDDYNAAVDKHGENSDEAQAASIRYMQALEGLEQAAIDGDLSFEEFSNRLDTWVERGKLTEGQAEDIRDRVGEARGEAESFEGDYPAELQTKQAAAVKERLRGVLSQLQAIAGTHTATVHLGATGMDVGRFLGAAGVGHDGGLVMHGGGEVGAPRMHSGGLRPDERRTILQTGEFVVQRPAVQSLGMDTMRQINQGQMPGGGGTVVNGPLIGEVKTLSGDRFSLPELENDLRFSGAA